MANINEKDIIIKVSIQIPLWDAIKIRIAGKWLINYLDEKFKMMGKK